MTRDLQSLNLLAKLMVLHNLILFSLAISAIAEAILMRRVAPMILETGHLIKLLAVHANICTDDVRDFDRCLAFFCADFYCICCSSLHDFVGEVLKFTIAAAHEIDVGKS